MRRLRFAGRFLHAGAPATILLMALGNSPGRAADSPSAPATDRTFSAAVELLHKAVAATSAKALSQDADAAPVIAALRSSHDRDLLPLFDKIRSSKVPENQIYGMVSGAILIKESAPGDATAAADAAAHVDLDMLFNSKSPELVGAAIASLIDAEVLSTEQLQKIVDKDPEVGHRVMAAAELQKQGKLTNIAPVREFLHDKTNVVRYYAASILLASPDPADVQAAVATLTELSSAHDLAEANMQALILVRMEKEKTSGGAPWAAQVAADDGFDFGLRLNALSALLSFHDPRGPKILSDMAKSTQAMADQLKLGLIALAHPDDLTPEMLTPLTKSGSTLAVQVAKAAQKAANHGNTTQDLVNLIKRGDPIMLDWSLSYSDQLDEEARIAIRTALVKQARIVDNQREDDYEHAALAVQRMLDHDGAVGRKTVADFLQSDDRSVVEATLAGIYRSTAKNQSELVLPIWAGLTKITSAETSANYAALILAREGRKEPLVWLPGMVAGGAVQGPGFRALSSWYYAKLTGRGDEFLKAVLAQ